MAKYHIDSELIILKPLKFKKYTNSRRFIANLLFQVTMFFSRPKKGVKRKHYTIKGYKHTNIQVTVYEKKDNHEISPALLYIHGGAFQMEGTVVHINMLMNIMMKTNYKIVYVRYRLAPKFPFPAGFFDCYHALLWMNEHHEYLKIDPNLISVGGDSAGGNLATAVALYARDHHGPKINKQMLIYPVVDMKQDTDSIKEFVDTPMWNSLLNKSMWEDYLKNGDFNMIEYASPSLAKDLKNMPKTYIETAQYDCLRDEAIDYARRLSSDGISVTEYHTRKTVHGYDAVFYSKLVKHMIDQRIKFLNEE
jgi:acetyl esterase